MKSSFIIEKLDGRSEIGNNVNFISTNCAKKIIFRMTYLRTLDSVWKLNKKESVHVSQSVLLNLFLEQKKSVLNRIFEIHE